MKIGICTTPQNATLLPKGVADYIEINITSTAQMNDADYESTKKFIAEHKINVYAANCFFPGDIKLCGKNLDMSAIESYTEHALGRVAALGVKICVIGSGKARNVEENGSFEICSNQLAEVCTLVGDIAAKHDITVVIEPLNKNETNMINTVSEGAAFVRRLNHPNIKLLADIYHMALENEPFDAIYDHRDIIRHIHIANPDKRAFPHKSDAFDYSGVVAAIKKADYNGMLSIEAGSKSDFKADALQSLTFLKSIF